MVIRVLSHKDADIEMSVLAEDLGFSSGRPVAALVIFRSCLQWKTFQADRTVLFDKVALPPPPQYLGMTVHLCSAPSIALAFDRDDFSWTS